MMLWKGAYDRKNPRSIKIFSICSEQVVLFHNTWFNDSWSNDSCINYGNMLTLYRDKLWYQEVKI